MQLGSTSLGQRRQRWTLCLNVAGRSVGSRRPGVVLVLTSTPALLDDAPSLLDLVVGRLGLVLVATGVLAGGAGGRLGLDLVVRRRAHNGLEVADIVSSLCGPH